MRDQFPFLQSNPDLIYFDSAATTHKPKQMIDSLSQFYAQEYATVHRAIYKASIKASEKYYQTRILVQKFLNARDSSEIIFTKGTTDSINLVAKSLGDFWLNEGDEIVLSVMEHHSNIVPWQMIAQKTKAKLVFMQSDERGILDFSSKITSKTKIVSVAHMSNVTGTIHPIAEIVKLAKSFGALVVVDGAQGAPHLKVDVQELGCDFYAFSAHKCYGPTGLGILYGNKSILEKMPPVTGGGDMIEKVNLEYSTYQDSPLRFEAGTPNIADVIAFSSSLQFIQDIGMDFIAKHGQLLLEQLTSELDRVPHLRILGTAPQKGPIVSFVIDGLHPLDVTTFLDLENIAIRSGHLCAQPIMRFFGVETAMRASFGVYNTPCEVDRFVKILRKVLQFF